MIYSLRCFSVVLVAGLFAGTNPLHAAPIANWGTDSGSAVITGLDTDSPAFGDGVSNNDATRFRAYSEFGPNGAPTSVDLGVGETLIVTSDFIFAGGRVGGTADIALRYVVGNNGGSSDNTNWLGGFFHDGARLVTANTNAPLNADVFSVSTNNNTMPTGASTTQVGTASLTDDFTYTFTMAITRDSLDTVDILSTLVSDNFDPVAPNGYSVTHAAEDFATNLFTYNAFGFQATNQPNTETIQLVGAQFNVIPEPASLVLAAIGGLTMLRRKQ